LSVLEDLTVEQRGQLFYAIYKYHLGDEINLDTILKIAFSPFKNQFKRDDEKYRSIVNRNRTNGLKGGRPKNPKNPVGCSETQRNPKKPKKADSDSDSGSDNKNNKEMWFYDLIPDVLRGNGFIDAWIGWVEFRKAKKKPISEKAAAAQLKKLAAHPNPEAVLEYSIMNDYQGLFPEKIKGVNNGTRKSPQELANRAEQIYNSITNEAGNRTD